MAKQRLSGKKKQLVDEWEEYLRRIRTLTEVDFTMDDADKAQTLRRLEADPVEWMSFMFHRFARYPFAGFQKKAIRRIETERDRTPDSIVVKQEYNNVTIPTNDILYIEAMENYTKIFRESGGYILSRTNMKALQEILPEESFLRIHRSYIVPIDRVEMFSKKKIKLAGQETLLPVGRQFANHIYDLLIARNSGGSRTNL